MIFTEAKNLMEQTGDSLLKAVRRAIRKADVQYLKTKHKEILTEYDEDTRKPVSETVREWETYEEYKGVADAAMLKNLAEAYIKLRAQTDSAEYETSDSSGGVVLLPQVRGSGNEKNSEC